MAIGFVEMQGQITRAQDFTTIKHNEDNKSMLQQEIVEQHMTKQAERQSNRVNQSQQPEYHNRKFDAKDKGSNEYHGNGGKDRKKSEEEKAEGKVLLKHVGHIDVSL